MSLIPYTAAEDVGDRFLALLHRLGIDPPRSSAREDELLSLTALVEIWKNPILADSRDDRDAARRTAAGIHDLAAKVLSAETLPDFSSFIEHLRLIGSSRLAATLSQNAASDVFDDTARKIAELYVGCLAVHCGDNVALDHPERPKGDNPDVMFTYEGRRWALAIKTVSSRSGQTIFERIREGALQIERSKAEVGMVVVNAKNAIDHAALLKSEFDNADEAIGALLADLRTLQAAAALNRPQSEWDTLFQAPKTVRPILFMAQSLTSVRFDPATSVPTPLKVMDAYSAGGQLDPDGESLAHCLNHWMQTLLKGQPPSSGTPPS